MRNFIPNKSKKSLQFKVFHTLVGFAVFFSLITIPAEAQVIGILDIPMTSDLLWWPIVFFIFQLIYAVYGLTYLQHTVYLVVIFHAITIFFLTFAISLPASSFWKMQELYTKVLGRDLFYVIKNTLSLWGCAFLPIYIAHTYIKKTQYIFLGSLFIFWSLDKTPI